MRVPMVSVSAWTSRSSWTRPRPAPGLRELARRFMEAETRHLGGPLGAASVMARRSEGARRTHHRGGRLLLTGRL